MNPSYPNLELVEYKVKQLLRNDKEFVGAVEKAKGRYAYLEFEAVVFPQIWGSTCTGFDVAEDGAATISGCAMTKEYTTIIHELLTDTYVVCFGNRPCYKVMNVNDTFLADLKKRNMAGLSEAKKEILI